MGGTSDRRRGRRGGKTDAYGGESQCKGTASTLLLLAFKPDLVLTTS